MIYRSYVIRCWEETIREGGVETAVFTNARTPSLSLSINQVGSNHFESLFIFTNFHYLLDDASIIGQVEFVTDLLLLCCWGL